MKHARLLAIATLGVLAVNANAFTIAIQSKGTFTAAELVQFTETTTFQWATVPLPALTDISYWLVNTAPPVGGQAMFTNGGADELDLDLTLQAVTTSGPTVSGAGVWTYAGGTGAYADLAGTGTFAFSLDIPSSSSFSSFIGNLTAVPEPTSLALLGVGAAALVGRRFKKSA